MKINKNIRNFVMTASIVAGAALTATPAEAQTPFPFSQNRARLVVLIHGVTPKPDEDPEIKIGSSAHARAYWGFDMIKGLQGRVDETTMRVITPRAIGGMRLRVEKETDWTVANSGTNAFDLAPICFPVSWNTQLPPGIETNQTLIKEHINLMTKGGANSTMVMVNTRDGSKHFMPQLAEAIDEIYRSYVQAYGYLPAAQQPQIYLVGHSFGGVIARGILANPAQMDLFGNSLPPAQRTQAQFLRDRVVAIQTLATPHTGTHMPDMAGDAAAMLQTQGLDFVRKLFGWVAALPWNGYSAEWVQKQSADIIDIALDEVSGTRDCLKDLARMNEYNNGILNTGTMRRSDGTWVPIYTATGRNPGNMFLDQSRSVFLLGGNVWNPISSIDLIRGTKLAKEAQILNLIEAGMHLKGYGKETRKPWGTATIAEGDKVAGPYAGIGATVRPVSAGLTISGADVKWLADKFLTGKPYAMGKADGEWDNDGFVGFDSGHGIGLSGNNWFRVFPAARYGGQLPWDIDNHSSIRYNAGVGLWIHNEIVRGAGPFVNTAGLRRSVWGPLDTPTTPLAGIRIDFTEIRDLSNLDYGGADFRMTVRVGSQEGSVNLPNDKGLITSGIPFAGTVNFPGTIIPIRIDLLERDNPSAGDPDDLCVISPQKQQSSLYLYFDTRTNRITGDLEGVAGDILTGAGPAGITNRAQIKLKITRTQ